MPDRFFLNKLIIIFFLIAVHNHDICLSLNLDDEIAFHQDLNFISDSTKIDSITSKIDSIIAPKTSSVGLDTLLKYEASIVDTRVNEKKIYLIGQANVKYKTMHLTAEKITVDWDANLITAEGVPDTIYETSDNPGDSVMTVKWRGLPTISDAGDVMNGFKMIYNYKTEKGHIIQGRTEFGGGYYSGDKMKKVSKEIINISNGYFTSCEREDEPHYHFRSRRIKVIIGDKVIAKPVIMYFGHMPVAALPFIFFSNKQGRQSGVIIPTYGQSASEGRFIRGLGYYWAASEYWDTALKVDYFDRSGWILRGDLKYNLRYMLNGGVSGSFTHKDFVSGRQQRRWDLIINHRHTIDPTSSFGISGRFVSDNDFYRDLSSNVDTRLSRVIRSDATFSKSWSEKRLSISANLSEERDIETGQISRTLPRIRFDLRQRPLFGKSNKGADTRSSSSSRSSMTDIPWYQSINFSYSSNLQNSITHGGNYADRITRYLHHDINLNMNMPQKIFGWLTLGQSFHYEERWYDRYKKNEFDPETNTVLQDTVQGFAARRIFSYSLNSTTKIYGMFAPNIGKIQALRHVISPNVSFSFQPNFSDQKWGYVDTFNDTSGEQLPLYQRLLDAVPSTARRSISMSLGNLFQMKTVDGEKEKKYDLFTLNFSSSYNFEAEEFNLSNLSSSFRTNPTRNLNININASHSFYHYDYENRKEIDRILLLDKNAWRSGKILRLNNLRIGASLRLQGSKKTEGKKKKPQQDEEQQLILDEVTGEPVSEEEYYNRLYEPGGDRFEVNDRFSGLDIPWRMSLSFNFSLNKYDPKNPIKTYYLDINSMEVQLTKNWKINYTAHFDLQSKQVVNHQFTIYRDLHCWEARITWRPSGIGGNSYYFRINVKSPLLRDLKFEQRGGRSSVLRY